MVTDTEAQASSQDDDTDSHIRERWCNERRLIDWRFWAMFQQWTRSQAVRLLFGLDPGLHSDLKQDPNDDQPGLGPLARKSARELASEADQLALDQKMETASPEEWVRWALKHFAEKRGEKLHLRCIRAVRDMRPSAPSPSAPSASDAAAAVTADPLPADADGHLPAVAGPRGDTDSILKKAALIRQCTAVWPTIERDLRDGHRNGLVKEAHAGEHGEYSKEKALAWAKRKGRLLDGKDAPSPTGGALLQTSWSNTVRRNKPR